MNTEAGTTPPPLKNPDGSALKGALLNIGLNVFICVIWIPLCALDGGGYSSSTGLAGNIGIVFFFGGIYIGIAQIVHVLPLGIYFAVQKQPKTNKGMLISAFVIFLLWGATFLTIYAFG